ncbi:hypothetical protein SDC9_161036 [bioreactor metagenome]|uniref:Uncharacterized protein n=1 Tax=bioreactor metagenome TaxID=1076179 RepID=A0A645FJK7_9ZZZZ
MFGPADAHGTQSGGQQKRQASLQRRPTQDLLKVQRQKVILHAVTAHEHHGQRHRGAQAGHAQQRHGHQRSTRAHFNHREQRQQHHCCQHDADDLGTAPAPIRPLHQRRHQQSAAQRDSDAARQVEALPHALRTVTRQIAQCCQGARPGDHHHHPQHPVPAQPLREQPTQ